VSRHYNDEVNNLAQQATSYNASNKNFNIIKKPMFSNIQNLEFLPDRGPKTGLPRVIVSLIDA
jgi:hypothetical protein